MSVTLISPPEEISFSADFINAGFQCDGFVQTPGVKSVNTIKIGSLTQPTDYVIQYGDSLVIMTAKTNPDNSGSEFLYVPWLNEAPEAALAALPYFQNHPILSTDFNITATSDNKIILTAKQDGRDYDILGYNTTAGTLPKLKENYTVYVRLMVQNPQDAGYTEAYSANLPLTFGTNKANAVLGDKLHQRLTADLSKYGLEIPEAGIFNCNVSRRRYFFQYGESYGQPASIKKLTNSPIYFVAHGGLSYRAKGRDTFLKLLKPGTVDKDRFLVQGPAEVSTRTDQPQYLYFLNTRDQVNLAINCKFYFTDGTFAAIPLQSTSLSRGGKIGFRVQFDKLFNPVDFPARKVKKYEIWLSNAGGAAISEVRSYVLDDSYKEFYKYFLFWNSWGALESRMFYGKGSVEFDLVQSVAERNSSLPGAISQGTSTVFNSSIQTKFSITTGFIANKSLLYLNREFFISTMKYILSDGKLLPIRVTSKTIGEIEDGNNLFAQKFEYQYLFEDQAYTEGDVYKPVPPPVRIIGQIYFGPSLTRPVSAADVLKLPNTAPAASYLIPVVTGLNKFISVAYPKITKKFGNAFDNTSQENVTSEYLPIDLIIDGIPYELRTMELAKAYPESHDHILTITDV
jgi:hypothetical protein